MNFKLNPFTGALDIVSSDGENGGGGDGDSYKSLKTVVLQSDIDIGKLTMSVSPTQPTVTVVMIKGAPSQYYGDDFVVSGNELLFLAGSDNDGLANVLSAGDKITIFYK